MDDLIRRSAANLLLISQTLAATVNDAEKYTDASVHETSAHPTLSPFDNDEEPLILDKK